MRARRVPPFTVSSGTNFAFQSGVLLNAEHDLLLVCASNSGSMLMRVAFRMMMEGVLQIASQQEQ